MANAEKILTGFIVLTIIAALFSLFYVSKSLFFPSQIKPNANAISGMGSRISTMSLTPFDVELAKELMDKNKDGKCDSCGMDVDMCISSGQLQCNMDSKSTIGILGSQHIHADLKIYINGESLDENVLGPLAMDMSKMDSQITSSFIHFDEGALPPEKAGDVLHMHATGVPLWIFFESIGMRFDKECFVMDDGKSYCNDGNNNLKFLVNGIENSEYEEYVFNDNDKILVSYGNEGEEEIKQQLSSITDFSKNHQK